MSDTRGPRAQSAQELKEQIVTERDGRPFLVYRDDADEQRIVRIEEGATELWIGRSPSADLGSRRRRGLSGSTPSSSSSREDARSSTTGSRATAPS